MGTRIDPRIRPQSPAIVDGSSAAAPDTVADLRPAQTFERGSLCYRCNFEVDPQECCERVTFLNATRQPPSWFDALTLVGGFAAVVIIIIICCVHQFRQQTQSFRGRRPRQGWRGRFGPAADGDPDEAFIVYVDLNGKQAFPIAELPADPADPAAAPADPPQHGTAPAAAGPAAAAHAAPAAATAFGGPVGRGSRVLRGAAFALCELPLWTAQRLSRRTGGAAAAADAAPAGGPAAIAAEAGDAAAAAGPDSVEVSLDGGGHAAAAPAAAVPQQVQHDRKQWFDNIPAAALPLVAVQPDAQLCLCRMDSQAAPVDTSDPPATTSASATTRTPSQDIPIHPDALSLPDPVNSAPAPSVFDSDGSGPLWELGWQPGAARAADGNGESRSDAPAAGAGDADADAAGGAPGARQSGDAAANGPDVPPVLYFFKAEVARSDFDHVIPAEPAPPRSWTGGLLQGLSGWLAPGSLGSTQRKGSWGLNAGSGDWEAAAERSLKGLLHSKADGGFPLSGGAEAAEGGDGEPSRKGKGSSRVLEGVWLALAGRGGSRQLDPGEESTRGSEGMPSARPSVGGRPGSAATLAPQSAGILVDAV